MPLPTILPKILGLYALYGYLPFSHLSRRIRARTGRTPSISTRLPELDWRQFFTSRTPRLVEYGKRSGNVRVSELALLSLAAQECPREGKIFEIGTFDGRTTLNLAWNASEETKVWTLDLSEQEAAALAAESGENYLHVQRLPPGARFLEGRYRTSDAARSITQLYGDSAKFDPDETLAGQCRLIFVDGSHTEAYAESDTNLALRLAAPGAVIFWHDYGVWPGLTTALEAFENEKALGIRHLRGTSLAVCRLPA